MHDSLSSSLKFFNVRSRSACHLWSLISILSLQLSIHFLHCRPLLLCSLTLHERQVYNFSVWLKKTLIFLNIWSEKKINLILYWSNSHQNLHNISVPFAISSFINNLNCEINWILFDQSCWVLPAIDFTQKPTKCKHWQCIYPSFAYLRSVGNTWFDFDSIITSAI